MILIFIILFVAGFFFPPAWLIFAGYVIYVFASKKSRRDDAVEDRVKRMISAGREYAVFSDLYFDAARSYAMAKGAKAPEQDAASATIIVNSRSYFVTFMKDSGGGTVISARDKCAVENEIEKDLQERLESYETNKKSKNKDCNYGNGGSPSRFVNMYFASMNSISDVEFDKICERPLWVHSKESLDEFTSHLFEESLRLGIAEAYVITIASKKDFLNLIFACSAAAESQGFDFKFQKEAGVEIIKKFWEELSEENKKMAKNISIGEKHCNTSSF